MAHLLSRVRRAWRPLSVGLGLLYFQAAMGIPIAPTPEFNQASPPLLGLEMPTDATQGLIEPGAASGLSAMNSLARGRWSSACHTATATLAHKVADVNALGIFSLCSAIGNDKAAANKALDRLLEAEISPYFSLLTQGILRLKEGTPEKAGNAFGQVLRSHTADPLALYFSGEALHAQHKDAEAIAAFKGF